MNLYGNTPQERAMQSLIHDTNSAFSRMREMIKKQDQWLKANVKTITEAGIKDSTMFITTEYFRSIEKELKKHIDVYYQKFSEDFPDPLLNQREEK